MTMIDPQEVREAALGRLVALPGHVVGPVLVEAAESLDGLLVLRVRTSEGGLREVVISPSELASALEKAPPKTRTSVSPHELFLLIESARIRLAYAHDPHFAVELTGIDVLPHQLAAVYERMLPQVSLRFLLADDPGAGKTIMSGLLLKELRLRGVVERVLILCPAPLTIQWQDELSTKFDETFELMTSERIKGVLTANPWHEYSRCIASIDLAKRDEVRDRLLEAHWDLVVIDEAHKCSARTDGDKVSKTQRYQLAERLSRKAERLLMLTATPHQGNADQFNHFLRLLDEDQFIDAGQNKAVIQVDGNPWYLRRMKEDLRDFDGQLLFTKRHAVTQPFELTPPEAELYHEVTEYINEFLPKGVGRKRTSVALARIVFQRRLASSLGAITSSLERRHKRFGDMLREVEGLPEAERAKKLQQFRLVELVDVEQDEGDQDEEQEDQLVDLTVVAETIERLREEVEKLEELVGLARMTLAIGKEAKLEALKNCLERAEFAELKDGRGKLLIFTEHKDTLEYLLKNLRDWGYTTTYIHGGMTPHDRKKRQIEFQRDAQVCVATEAAGEGINLQFCHLMINYDMPWNPMRLEQRMGRIHRIGQTRDVHVFNFAATNTVEGQIVARLLLKLEEIRGTLGDRVFDVIGELLKLNEVNLEDMLREAAYNPQDITAYIDQIERISPERLREYEEAVGIALAKSQVDLARVKSDGWRSQERRLMPEYVEGFFLRAADTSGLTVEPRADGLWRAEHVPHVFRADELAAVKSLGRPDTRYLKFTFDKQVHRQSQHLDSDLVSPGHPLFAAVDEVLNRKIDAVRRGAALFVDPFSPRRYRLHFYDVEVEAGSLTGGYEPATGALVTVVEDESGALELGAPDLLHDLTPVGESVEVDLRDDHLDEIRKYVMAQVQYPMVSGVREDRKREIEIRRNYLEQSFEISIRKARERWMRFADQVNEGRDELRLVRDNAEREWKTLEQRRDDKLEKLENLAVVAQGKVEYLGTALVSPTGAAGAGMRRDDEAERAAMELAMAHEVAQGWEPEDVSRLRDGSGFDIRSVGPPDGTGQRAVRRIEVKGRSSANLPVELTPNEWVQAGRHGDSYWLYVVWNAKSASPELLRVQNPAITLKGQVEELVAVRGWRVPAAAIAGAAAA